MSSVFPLFRLHPRARLLAGVLCALLAVTPVEGKRFDEPAGKPSDTTNSGSQKPKTPTRKPASSATDQSATKKSGSSKSGASVAHKKAASSKRSVTAPR